MKILLLPLLLLASCSSHGDKIPKFAVPDLSGNVISSETLKGKVVVIKIWATWCGPCRSEMEDSNALAATYATDTNVVFLSVTDEPEALVRDFLSRNEFNYRPIANASNLKDALHPSPVKTIPRHIVVNKKGIITFEHNDLLPNLKEVLDKEIRRVK